MPLDVATTPELTKTLVDASLESGRQVGVLVHRSGSVDFVVVGDAGKLMLPDIGRLRAAEGRFRGLRLVHTHVRGEPLTRDDLVDLVRLRLDLVLALQLSPRGEVRTVHYAYNVPAGEDDLPYREVGPLPPGHLDLDVGRLMTDLEAEFARASRARDVRAKDGRAVLVHVASKSDRASVGEAGARVRELSELARTAGVEVADVVVQVRDHVDARHVLGKGKLEEVILRAMQLDADVLVFDRELTPTQASTLAKASDLKILDRTQLILDIFAQRAESADGKLQVELAQLKYTAPRLAQKDDSLSRLTGGIGGRGPGETKLEIGRRRAKERIAHLESELKRLARQRRERRRGRASRGAFHVALVGYTNAGKSTVLHALTSAEVLREDKLFATLDTRSRVVRAPLEDGGFREMVVTDTVGFIRDLPKDLFAAFRATFEESADADVLVQVVDASDDDRQAQLEATDAILAELGLGDIPRLLVWNKADRLEPFARKILERTAAEGGEALALSALEDEGVAQLRERLLVLHDQAGERRRRERAPRELEDFEREDDSAQPGAARADEEGAHAPDASRPHLPSF